MAKRILLIDDSLTVQKVVALTLDAPTYEVRYAKSRGDAMRSLSERPPDLVLISDNVSDLNIQSFPREMEAWVPPSHRKPPLVLICGQEAPEAASIHNQYEAILQKPFSPNTLLAIVQQHVQPDQAHSSVNLTEMESNFNQAFSDEASLVNATLSHVPEIQSMTAVDELTRATSTQPSGGGLWGASDALPLSPREFAPAPEPRASSLWGNPEPSPSPNKVTAPNPLKGMTMEQDQRPRSPMHPQHSQGHSQLMPDLSSHVSEEALTRALEHLLDKMVPPIVERLVQQRLDALLSDQESSN